MRLLRLARDKYRRDGFVPLLHSGVRYLIRTLGIDDTISEAGKYILKKRYDDSGTEILNRDWDTLVIFDCGRYDIFSNVVDRPGDIHRKRSVASETGNFIMRNFDGKQAHDIVYLSANPTVGQKSDCVDVHKLVGMWDQQKRGNRRGQEQIHGLNDPRPVINKARELHQEYPNKRHIVHLLPPHTPHIFKDGERLDDGSPYRNYEAARAGSVNAEVMRGIYAENLEYTLSVTDDLISDVDGKIVLTADHGELLGEGMPRWMKFCHNRWGNQWEKYDFGHYRDCDVDELREIPWFEVPWDKRREIKAEPPVAYEYDRESIEEHLTALGYR